MTADLRRLRSAALQLHSWDSYCRLAKFLGGFHAIMVVQKLPYRYVVALLFYSLFDSHYCACHSQETMEMGSCWGIAGSSGRLSVKFAQQIVADAITIDHIPAQIASDFTSAPKDFRIMVRG